MIGAAALIGSAALGAGGSIASSALNAGLNYAGNKDLQNMAQEFNAAQAQLNRDWSKEMSSTVYQRAVEDMKAAGLNPAALGASAGASSANGSSAASVAPGHYNAGVENPFSGLINSAMQRAIGSDRNVANKVIASAKIESANARNRLNNEVKKEIADLRWGYLRNWNKEPNGGFEEF